MLGSQDSTLNDSCLFVQSTERFSRCQIVSQKSMIFSLRDRELRIPKTSLLSFRYLLSIENPFIHHQPRLLSSCPVRQSSPKYQIQTPLERFCREICMLIQRSKFCSSRPTSDCLYRSQLAADSRLLSRISNSSRAVVISLLTTICANDYNNVTINVRSLRLYAHCDYTPTKMNSPSVNNQ